MRRSAVVLGALAIALAMPQLALAQTHRQGRQHEGPNGLIQGFGGIRIEDNVLIRDGGNEVLTRAIPKE